MAFARRIINLRFELGAGDFGSPGIDTVDLSGQRMSVDITHAGGNSLSLAELRIWGMSLDVMNRLTLLNVYATPERVNNRITISAGDGDGGVAVCFVGGIQEAWIDGSDLPGVAFHVAAASAFVENIRPIAPTAYKGTVDVAIVLSGIAAQMGLSLENSGVSGVVLNDPYFPGALGAQLESICQHAHVEYHIDSIARVLAVWPVGKQRDGESIIMSAYTGMVGFPTFTQSGIRIRSLYNPNLIFGRKLLVTSDFSSACGMWVIANVNHNLDCETPGGAWFTEVECTLFGHSPPIPGR